MPRVTTDRLLGYGFACQHRTEPVMENGQVLHDGRGDVRVADIWDLVFADPTTGHTLIFPLSRDARDALVQSLTGGILVANGSHPVV